MIHRRVVFLWTLAWTVTPAAAAPRPNILFILCDDLGYGDLGAFYQNERPGPKRFATPEIDRLAAEGLMLTDHYAGAPVCAPSRASLLLGRHQGHAQVRNNQFDKALEDTTTVACVLQAAGYHSALVGKYGLGGSEAAGFPAHPLRRGFDEFFGYMKHVQGHEHYPRNGTTGKKAFLTEGFDRITTDTDKVYTTDVFTARAKQLLIDRSTDPDHPLFLLLAYDTPHMKQQVPAVAYPAGRGLHGGIQWTGPHGSPPYVNTATGTIDSYRYPEHRRPDWPDAAQIHATMVRRIDDAVGDLLQTLRDLGVADRTLVVFSSDNGPHNVDGQDPRFFGTYAHFDGIKRDIWEGGIRVPTVAWWPGHIPAGTVTAHPCAQWDWLPTFAELAGIPAPAYTDGVSLLPTLLDDPNRVQPESRIYIEYDHGGRTPNYADFAPAHRNRVRRQMQALRVGDFMAVRLDIQDPADPFEIYDVVRDTQERFDLAADPALAALRAGLRARVAGGRRPDPSAPRPYDHETMAAVSGTGVPGLEAAYYEGVFPWVPDFRGLVPIWTGPVTGLDLAARRRDTDFGFAFRGTFHAPSTATYRFYLTADTGAHLILHEAHLLHVETPDTTAEARVRLSAGDHPLRLYYRHTRGTPRLRLDYSGERMGRREVPPSAYSQPPAGW